VSPTGDAQPRFWYRPAIISLFLLAISIFILASLAVLTNRMALEWDMSYYLDMARNGLVGNRNLAAPFAYRFAAPLLVGAIAHTLGADTELTFRICCALACILFILSSFYFAKSFGATDKAAILASVLPALYFYIIKWAIFSGTMVDIFAYPVLLLAFWALLRDKFYLCLVVSAVGLFFKEFLLLPLLTQAAVLVIGGRRAGWRKLSIPLLLTAFVLLTCFLFPRMLIHVARTFQDIDPINDRSSLRRLILYPLSRKHDFNILFAYMACWLPILLLLTKDRCRLVWGRLRKYRVALGVYMALHFCLAMYGGTNLDIYPTYCLPMQIMVLVLILDNCRIPNWEWVLAMALVIVFNRLWMQVPLPQDSMDKYLDFYGGYYMRVTAESLLRMGELLTYILGFWIIRFFVLQISKPRLHPVTT
jgi:hypothetical protein